jgi:hypothetical protein
MQIHSYPLHRCQKRSNRALSDHQGRSIYQFHVSYLEYDQGDKLWNRTKGYGASGSFEILQAHKTEYQNRLGALVTIQVFYRTKA